MKCRAKVQKINETTTLFCFFYIKKEIVTLGIGNNLCLDGWSVTTDTYFLYTSDSIASRNQNLSCSAFWAQFVKSG